ncbi:MAG: MBL fold metallo-hydrolase [Fibrobacter sp.]|nr:MBL fold metallo-hydrolase [Fibrobacter sp.]
MLKFCVLRSGSSGNCTLIEYNGFRILIDAGMSQKRIREALEEVGLCLQNIHAIIITHLHSDHLNHSTFQICNKHSIPLWIHSKNIPLIKPKFKKNWSSIIKINGFDENRFKIGDISIKPFETSHDSDGITTGFCFIKEEKTKLLTYAADLGYFPDAILPYFIDSQALILEANHDVELLKNNPARPFIHKKRVLGELGHLSNNQTADALTRIFEKSLFSPQVVVLCHLSNDHNSPELAKRSIDKVLKEKGISISLDVAQRYQCTKTYSIKAVTLNSN